jgi:hypothetical protein
MDFKIMITTNTTIGRANGRDADRVVSFRVVALIGLNLGRIQECGLENGWFYIIICLKKRKDLTCFISSPHSKKNPLSGSD